ncbi:MAG: hypothetical protein HY822_18045 [Acidobacteria bacterium]|nr:hypothetical protein [Acidobacteriota bacterium]
MLLLAAITITTAFEAGSLGRVEAVSPVHLRCALKGQADQDGRNRQASWYYFRLDGLPKQEVRLELTDLVGEYNYKPGSHAVTRNTRPVYSYDDRTWKHFPDGNIEWDEKQVRLTLRFTPERGRMWIAHVPPYTTAHLARLLGDIGRSPHVRQEPAGKTTQGRELPLVTITDLAAPERDKKTIWIMARQHAWETGTSWVVDGAMRFLVSGSPEAARLRREILWKFFPLADPDGVVNGQVRFNTHGFDVNRNWDTAEPSRMAEIAAMKNAMLAWIDGGRRIDLFLTLHNQEGGDYIDGPPGDGAQRFFEALAKTDSFQASGGPRNIFARGAVEKGRMTVNQALFHERKVQAFLMELGVERNVKLGRPRTTGDNLAFGPALLQALASVL